MQVYGNASRAGIGGDGLGLPLDPPVLTAQMVAERLERQAQRQAAAEDAAALVARPKRRRPRTETFSVASVSAVPARVVAAPAPLPLPVPAVVDVIEDLVPARPVPCEAPDCSQVVTPEFVARTGQRIHPPCRARQQAAASTRSTTAHRTRELVGAGRRAS